MSYLETKDKQECCGCEACVQICPKKAIKLKVDEEGFRYPEIDESKCIHCNLCNKVCPVQNMPILNKLKEQKFYGMRIKKLDILTKSSSGGGFFGICEKLCQKDYVIFGAKYTENFKVQHSYITDINNIQEFQKSKYVQSEINDSYIKAREFLEAKKLVIFSGTPCQIAGLRNFLKKDYDNLICIDIICHGVPSYKVFKKYIEYEENKKHNKLKKIVFREKMIDENDKYDSKKIRLVFEDGTNIVDSAESNLFLRGFYARIIYRPSCYSCPYAKSERYGDLTIADCWGIEKIDSSIDIHKGYSLIIANTKKGNSILNNIKSDFEYIPLTIDFVKQNNACFSVPSYRHPRRAKFFKHLDKVSIEKNINKSLKPIGIRNKLKALLPKKIKKSIKKILKKS